MAQDDTIAGLEARLRATTGPGRLEPIMRLVPLLGERYQRHQPGAAAGLHDLDAIVTHMREALTLLPREDQWYDRTVAGLGLMLAMRHLAHNGPASDRDEAIERLAEASESTRVAPVMATTSRFFLGQLLSMRGMREVTDLSGPPDMAQAMRWMNGGGSASGLADVERGVACIERVLTESPPAEVRQAAEGVLPMMRMMRDMLAAMNGSGGAGGMFDAVRAMRAFPAPPVFPGGGMRPPTVSAAALLFPTGPDPSAPGGPGVSEAGGFAPGGSAVAGGFVPSARPAAVVVDAAPPAGARVPAPRRPRPAPDLAPLRAEVRDRLARIDPARPVPALLRPDLPAVPAADAEELVALALDLAHRGGLPADHLSAAVALWLRSRTGDGGGWGPAEPRDDGGPDVRHGAASLLAAVDALDPEGPLAGPALGALAAFLSDRHPSGGVLDEVAEGYVAAADRFLADPFLDRDPFVDGGPDSAVVRALRETCAAHLSGPVDRAAWDAALEAVPERFPWRFRLLAARGVDLVRGGDPAAGRDLLARALDAAPEAHPGRAGLAVSHALAAVAAARAGEDPTAGGDPALREAAALLDAVAADPGTDAVRGALRGDPGLLSAAAERGATAAAWQLALALRTADPEAARQHALRALRGSSGIGGDDAALLAGWCLTDGDPHGAFAALVAARSRPARDTLGTLIEEALTGTTTATGDGPGGPEPSVEETARALRTLGVDALVHLHPCAEGVGALLLDPADATVTAFAVRAVAGGEWDGWARALLDPVLCRDPRRLVLIPSPGLDAQPWHTVCDPDTVVAYAASAAEVVAGAGRTWGAFADDAVFVANPRGDRDEATFEVLALRRLYYPASTGLGRVVELVHGAAVPQDVWPHLPGPGRSGAALLHLGCAVRVRPAVALGLAGRTWLRLPARTDDRSPTGGLVVLPPDCPEWAAVATAFVDAGALGVVGWLRPVPSTVAGPVVARLHAHLVDDGLAPAEAVAAVRRSMEEARPLCYRGRP